MLCRRFITLMALAALCLAGAAGAQVPYLPLAQSNTWTYVDAAGALETWLVTGQTSVFDQDVWIIEYPGSDENGDLENYWTEGDDGDVLLHGFWRGWGYAYDPPVVLADAPLELGKTWSTNFDIYLLPEMTFDSTVTIYFEVMEAGVIVVPAGSFEAFGVGAVDPPVFRERGRQFSLTGELIQPTQRQAADWWSLGVGEVQYETFDFFQLESYQLGSVAVQGRTWSGVKNLFD